MVKPSWCLAEKFCYNFALNGQGLLFFLPSLRLFNSLCLGGTGHHFVPFIYRKKVNCIMYSWCLLVAPAILDYVHGIYIFTKMEMCHYEQGKILISGIASEDNVLKMTSLTASSETNYKNFVKVTTCPLYCWLVLLSRNVKKCRNSCMFTREFYKTELTKINWGIIWLIACYSLPLMFPLSLCCVSW